MRISLFCTYLSNKYVFKWVHKVQLTKLNKRFALNEMFQRNASKLAILYIQENPHSFFRFSFHTTLLMNALVFVDIRGKVKLHKMKNKKNYVGFLIHKIQQILKCFAGTFR